MKFSLADIQERQFWDDYQEAYEDALNKCSTKAAPWYIVPAGRCARIGNIWSRSFCEILETPSH